MSKIRMSRPARAILGVAIAAPLLATGILITTTNVAVGKVVGHTRAVTAAATAKDLVGTGLFNCTSGSGEVGYSPASVTGGTQPMMISVWLEATKCKSIAGAVPAKPLPTDVILSFSIEEPGPSLPTSTCPISGTWLGNANLAYSAKAYPFPPKDTVGSTGVVTGDSIIDPSVAMSAGLTTGGATWTINGATAWWGSYPSGNFVASFHPWWLNATGTGSCSRGITSGWVDDVVLKNV
jgi:hypothetical protein